MKNLLVVLFLFVTCTVFGQLQKGNLLIGGSLNFSNIKTLSASQSSFETKTTVINANPRVGLFLTDRSVLGLEPGYTSNKIETGYLTTQAPSPVSVNTTTKVNTFSGSVFYRYYFPLGEKVSLFLHSKAGLASGKSKYKATMASGVYTSNDVDITSFGGSISPGIAFFVTKKISVEGTFSSLSYQSDKQKPSSGKSNNSHNLNFQYSLVGLGVSWYLGK